jgi:hypothetical protein
MVALWFVEAEGHGDARNRDAGLGGTKPRRAALAFPERPVMGTRRQDPVSQANRDPEK